MSLATCTENENNTVYVDCKNMNGPWDGSLEYPYQFIQDGVDAAVLGDTVFVFNGSYYEEIIINKSSIDLIGESKYSTIVYGNNNYPIFSILGSHVSIQNFTIQNTNGEGIGIKIGDFLLCTHAKIKNNIIINTSIGILTPSTFIGDRHHHHHIMNNVISNSSEYGIILKVTDFCQIEKNSFIGNNCGVKLGWSIGNLIKQNNFIDNDIDATFDSSFLTHWSGNYFSDHVQNFPYIIYGTLFYNEYPWINFDWYRANEAYDTNMKHTIGYLKNR